MSWTLVYEGFDPNAQGLREALCTLGNGRFATRGAMLDAVADGVHYPGTYLAGGYDRSISRVAGREIENEDLVNWPNWLPIRLRIDEDDWLRATPETAIEHRQTLDMRAGVLARETRLRDGKGRTTRLTERRIVSMADPRLAAIELCVLPEDWAGTLTVRSLVDGAVTNAGVPRYRALDGQHLMIGERAHPCRNVASLRCRTLQSGIEAAMAARLEVLADGEAAGEPTPWSEPERVGLDVALDAGKGTQLRIEKTVAFATSRDRAIASPGLAANEAVAAAEAFAPTLEAHRRAWETLWDDFDLELDDGVETSQQELRLNLFHLLQTLSPHTAEMDVGAPARGWHGEAYRGHVFWDELFVFRVLNLRAPRLTRELLRYRYRRLPAARRLARAQALPGAIYPWQSGSDGREETQTLHLNPRSGRWLPDNTHRQRHVGLGLAYNVWNYYRATSDLDFMIEGGAEMLVEIARAFAGLASLDDALGRYRIPGVMGPDEFHTAYPGVDPVEAGGIDDNAYTNVLCAWAMSHAVDALEQLPPSRRTRLADAIGLADDEVSRWQDIAERLHVPFLSNGLIAQFEGYDALEELDWDAYRARYGDIHRLDRILEAEGRDVNAYKASKQADVLMLPFLFSSEELRQIFEQLGYIFDPGDLQRLVTYYDARTSHGSTLSGAVHAWVVARSSRARSWTLLREALKADVEDVQGGTTREGIHLGAMCGTIDMIQSGYLGLMARRGALHLDPVLPDTLRGIRTRVRYLGQDIDIDATCEAVHVAAGGGSSAAITIDYRGHQRRLTPGTGTTFRLVRPHERRSAPPCEPEASPVANGP